jgi:hypothetical protein
LKQHAIAVVLCADFDTFLESVGEVDIVVIPPRDVTTLSTIHGGVLTFLSKGVEPIVEIEDSDSRVRYFQSLARCVVDNDQLGICKSLPQEALNSSVENVRPPLAINLNNSVVGRHHAAY